MTTWKNKLVERFMVVMLSLVLGVMATTSPVYAAEEETFEPIEVETENLSVSTYYGTGDYYLGQQTFYNIYNTSSFTVGGNYMRIRLAFKKADSATSDVDIDVYSRRTVNLGGNYFHYRFCKMHDSDGPDANGYYYVVSDWQEVDDGEKYNISLDACTAKWETQPGYYRSADVHVWLEIS